MRSTASRKDTPNWLLVGNGLNQGVDVDVPDVDIGPDQPVDQFTCDLQPPIGNFGNPLVVHAQGDHLQIRTGQQRQQRVISNLFKRNGVDHCGPLVYRKRPFDGLRIGAIDGPRAIETSFTILTCHLRLSISSSTKMQAFTSI